VNRTPLPESAEMGECAPVGVVLEVRDDGRLYRARLRGPDRSLDGLLLVGVATRDLTRGETVTVRRRKSGHTIEPVEADVSAAPRAWNSWL
jgi:hypothetical protein